MPDFYVWIIEAETLETMGPATERGIEGSNSSANKDTNRALTIVSARLV